MEFLSCVKLKLTHFDTMWLKCIQLTHLTQWIVFLDD